MGVRVLGAGVLTLCAAFPVAGATDLPADRFREANALVRAGDYPKGIAIYRELATAGEGSASLFWNWAQAAAARGSLGEAMWALLQGRELEPGDKALSREIERVRDTANLDGAEIAPEPMAVLARLARRLHLGVLAVVLGALSVVFHALARLLPGTRWSVPAGWTALALAAAVSAVPLAGALARPTAVVVTRDAPLVASASPTGEVLGSLREAEVVPILERSAGYLRIEDSSGARGWVHAADVWPLE